MATVYLTFNASSADVGASAQPELVTIAGTNFPACGYAFADSTTDEMIYSRVTAPLYGSGNVTFWLDWYSRTGQTSNAVVWGVAISVLTPGDAQSIETDSFATENTATSTVNSTARGLTRATVTVSNLDGIAADDSVEFRITRRQSNGSDTMSGDAVLVGVTISYSD